MRQLQELGYRVIGAHDGAAALRMLEREPVDLLFTDIVMPGGWNGHTLAKHALANWPRLKALMTSGFPEAKMNGSQEVLMNLRLLTKPYRKDDLARAVREILDTD